VQYIIGLILICSLSPVLADTVRSYDDIDFSGFGTLGLVSTDSKYYGYRRDISQEDGAFENEVDFNSVSVFGLQVDANINNSLDAVYQGVYRDQNDISFDSITSMAFLRYSPNATWSVRLGRTPVDLFLLSEYRDIGFAYTWAQAPSEVYGMQPYRHLDGLDITYNTQLSNLTLRSKIYAGKSKADISVIDASQEFKLDNIYGISLSLEAINWSINARYAEVKFAKNTLLQEALSQGISLIPDVIWPNSLEFAESLSLLNRRVNYTSLSGRYDFGSWQLLSEITRTQSDSAVIPRLHAGYISLVKRYKDHAFYIISAFTDADNFDMSSLNVNTQLLSFLPGGMTLFNVVDQNINFYASNQQTQSIGWRWDIRENLAFKMQLDHTKIEEKGGTLWLNKNTTSIPGELLTPKESINTLSTNLSFTF
jgi:hypothetical protein